MNKRYQVFISSTYADLKEERSKVIQTIMELDCIPAGMEIFPAIDEEQFNFIKRIIDDCDYYILIIGGRYGSVSEDGLSYTEKEYDYANEKGIRIMAFLHENPDSITFGKSEKDSVFRDKLDSFKKKITTGRLVKFWNRAEDLPGLVALSLPKTIKTYPAVGWIRANSITNPELLTENIELRKNNDDLKVRVQSETKIEGKHSENLAGFEDEIIVSSEYRQASGGWDVTVTWEDIFYVISPHLLQPQNDQQTKMILTNAFYRKSGSTGLEIMIDDSIFQTIKIHLKALGLIDVKYTTTTKGGMGLFWYITPLGEKFMIQLRSVKKPGILE